MTILRVVVLHPVHKLSLIHILGILLEPEQLPMAANAVVINAETIYRLREAVEEKKPLIDKDMTVAGKLKENASIHVLLDVPILSLIHIWILQSVPG